MLAKKSARAKSAVAGPKPTAKKEKGSPANTGMEFVLVQHLDPRHKSNRAEILARSTDMSIAEATDGVRLEGDHAYVTPADMEMAVLHGVLHLRPRPESRGRYLPIDSFFRSLAEDQGGRAGTHGKAASAGRLQPTSPPEGGRPQLILLAIEEVTDGKEQ